MGTLHSEVRADICGASVEASQLPCGLRRIAAATAAVYECVPSKTADSIGPIPGPDGKDLYLISWGTCFAVHADGYYITAAHVVDTKHPIYVCLHGASLVECGIFRARILKVVKQVDLALLRAELPGNRKVYPAWLADDSAFNFALMGTTLGYFGFFSSFLNVGKAPPNEPDVQPDELSLVYRTSVYAGGGLVEIEKGIAKDTLWFQGVSTAGTSGGPLFLPESGIVIGVVVSQLRHLVPQRLGDEAAGLSVAIPVGEVRKMLDEAAAEGLFPRKEIPKSASIRTR